MPTIVLHGALKRQFGGPFALDVATPAEAFRALEANFPGRFLAAVKDGIYRIVRGDRKTGMALDTGELTFGLGTADLHIIPLARGAGRKGGAKAVIGVAIMAVAIVASQGAASGASGLLSGLGETAFSVLGMDITYGNIAMFGLSMTLNGVSQMLSPQPQARDLQPVDQRQSYLFSGPANLTEQGGAVPLIYGRCRVGSTVVSAGIDTAQMAAANAEGSGGLTAVISNRFGPGGTAVVLVTAQAGSGAFAYRISDITGGTLSTPDGTLVQNNGLAAIDAGRQGLRFDLDGEEENPSAGQTGRFVITGLRQDGSTFGTAAVEIQAIVKEVPDYGTGGGN